MKDTPKKYYIFLLFIIGLNLLLHANLLTEDIQGLHSWRQSQTMWNIKNFMSHDINILNPRVSDFNVDNDNLYRYEFPIMQWLIAMTQKIVGDGITTVRILMFLFGTIGIIGMYKIFDKLLSNKISVLLATCLFQFSPILYYYIINPLPDILALSCGIWYLYYFMSYMKEGQTKLLVLSSLALLMATLVKLPFLMFGVLTAYYVCTTLIKDKSAYKRSLMIVTIQGIILIPAFLWYAWVMPNWGSNPILTGIFNGDYTLFEFIKLIGYHAVKMFPNKLLTFIVWIPFFIGLKSHYKNEYETKWLYSLIFITMIYLFLQLTVIGRDHDYYLLPFLPWLFIIVSLGIDKLLNDSKKQNILAGSLVLASLLYAVVITYSWSSLNKTSFNHDVFLYSEELKSAVPNHEMCIMLNDHSNYIFSYQIDKMGYIFNNDQLEVGWIGDLVRNYDVKYMYSDSEKINNDPQYDAYKKRLILKKGSVAVYELKLPDE